MLLSTLGRIFAEEYSVLFDYGPTFTFSFPEHDIKSRKWALLMNGYVVSLFN